MEITKLYGLQGLDKKNSNLLRNPANAIDCLNVRIDPDVRNSIIKRPGIDVVETPISNLIDTVKWKRGDKQVQMRATGLYVDGLSVAKGGEDPDGPYTVPLSTVESGGCLYFADPGGINPIFKYDGARFYRAGVPTPSLSTTSAGTARYIRACYFYRDAQGNIHYGDYAQVGSSSATPDVIIAALASSQFNQAYGITEAGNTFGPGFDTITFKNHNFTVGDVFWWDKDISGYDKPCKVLNVVGNIVTFDVSHLSSVYPVPTDDIWSILRVAVFISSAASYGYYVSDTAGYYVGGSPIANPGTFRYIRITAGARYTSATPTTLAMEDIYDSSIVRELPPKARYITLYGNVLVAANIVIDDQETGKDGQGENRIRWCDLTIGGSVETFAPFNSELVGNTGEGEITGVYGSTTRVIVFKSQQVYYLEGTLISGGYRIYSTLSNGIGCIAHRSIIELKGSCIFLSEFGFYAVNGGTPEPVSPQIEPILSQNALDWDLTGCIAVNFIKQSCLLFYFPAADIGDNDNDRLLVLDYDTMDWWIWSGFNCRAGLLYDTDDGEIYFGEKGAGPGFICSIKKTDSSSKNDDTFAINSTYKTGWFHLDSPTLDKKFIKLVLMSLENLNWNCTVKIFLNWNDTTPVATLASQDFDTGIRVLDFPLIGQQAKAISFEISNNVVDEGMAVTGFEFEWAPTQTRSKGDN